MKRISKNKIEFDCIVQSINPIMTYSDDADKVEMIINYFDRDDEIHLIINGKYNAEHLQKLQQAFKDMEIIKITISIGEKDKEEVSI